MPTELDTKVQDAAWKRLSPLFKKERAGIQRTPINDYPFPPQRPSPTGGGRGMAMGGGMGPGGGLGMGGAPKGLGVGAGMAAAPTGGLPPEVPPAGSTMGMGQQAGTMGQPTGTASPIPVETQRDTLLALVLMLLGIGGNNNAV